MARHKQPLELAVLKGADKKDPQRYAEETPKSDLPLGPPPDDMSESAKKVWYDLQKRAIPGVLTGAEHYFMMFASNLIAEYKSDPEGFSVGKYNHMFSALARLGFSPADRQKLSIKKPDTKNPFDNLDE